jgi:histidinol-phosphatase
MTAPDLDLAMETARRAAEAGAAAAMRHFRAGVRVELKPDRSPVTVADREAEAAIVGVIRQRFPGHAILGEETGAHAGTRAGELARWIVDPVDGTRGFTRGGSFWGPLVALEVGGEVVAGAMGMPALGELYWAARGRGAWRQVGAGAPERLRVSGLAAWEEATLSLGELKYLLAPDRRDQVNRLTVTAAQARGYGDLAGCAMVLTGRAEAFIEAGVQIWDIAPLKILIEEAGGRFTALDGTATHASGSCVASNGLVHQHVLEALQR